MREIDDLAWKAYKIPRGVMKRVKKILEGKGEEGLVSNWKRGCQTNTFFSVQHNPAGSNITHIVGNGTVINQGIVNHNYEPPLKKIVSAPVRHNFNEPVTQNFNQPFT